MSDEILLYLILLLMLVLAVGALVPSLLHVGREEASVEREDKAYGSAVTEALRRQRAQLDEDLKSGAVSAEQYEILADDLRRRALEEHDAVFHDPNDGAGRRAGSFSGPVVTAAVVAGVTAVSVGLYAVNGAGLRRPRRSTTDAPIRPRSSATSSRARRTAAPGCCLRAVMSTRRTSRRRPRPTAGDAPRTPR